MTQYTDSASLNGLTLTSKYFCTAKSVSAEAGSVNGAVYYAGSVTPGAQAQVSGTISSSANGLFTVTPSSGVTTQYQVLGSTQDGKNLIFEPAQGAGSNTGPYFVLANNGIAPSGKLDNKSTNNYDKPVCFAAGTLIRTVRGQIAVEHLQVGDTVVTASGTCRRIVWTGSTRIHAARHPRAVEVNPVVISRGAPV